MMGFTPQAFYKRQKVCIERFFKEQMILNEVKKIRQSQPRVGTRKLHKMLNKADIKIGRDKLFTILRENNLLIKPRRNFRKTTNSNHWYKRYPNLIKEIEITESNQVWVADITYLNTYEGFCYLALITDVFSRKIVGYDLSKSLSMQGCYRALNMALKGISNFKKLIHHSDRGIQYCSNDYTKRLTKQDIKISMTEEDHVYENAIAERLNGILKSEFMLGQKLRSFEIAKELVANSIKIYNEQRLHMSINYEIPAYRYAA